MSRPRGSTLTGSFPLKIESPIGGGTITQVKIDQTLVRNVRIFREVLEIFDNLFIHPDRDLFLESFSIWIFAGLGKVVFVFHLITLCGKTRFRRL